MIIKSKHIFFIKIIILTAALQASENTSVAFAGSGFKKLTSSVGRFSKNTENEKYGDEKVPSIILKLTLDALLGAKKMRKYFYYDYLKKGRKIPKCNLFIMDIFSPGRKLGDLLDEPYISTDKPCFEKKRETLRESSIKIMLEGRDFLLGIGGFILGKKASIRKSKSLGYKYLGYGGLLEYMLEEKYVNKFFSTGEDSLKYPPIKEKKNKRTIDTTIHTNNDIRVSSALTKTLSSRSFSTNN